MPHRALVKAIVASIFFVTLALSSRAAMASDSQLIFTYGGQTFYQEAYPDQYGLCLTAESFSIGAILYSDYCGNYQTGDQNWTYSNGGQISQTQGGNKLCVAENTNGAAILDNCSASDTYWDIRGSELYNTYVGKCFDVVEGSTATHAEMDLWPCTGNANQTFWTGGVTLTFEPYSGNNDCMGEYGGGFALLACDAYSYTLTNNMQIYDAATGYCAVMNSSDQLVKGSCSSSGAYWTNGQQGNSIYAFYANQNANECLDVKGGIYKYLNPMIVWPCSTTDNAQDWYPY